MAKDRRYKTTKALILGGNISSLLEIFEVIPKTVVAKDLHIHNQRFNDLLSDVSLFQLGELYKLADLIEVDRKEVLLLAHRQHVSQQSKKPKK